MSSSSELRGLAGAMAGVREVEGVVDFSLSDRLRFLFVCLGFIRFTKTVAMNERKDAVSERGRVKIQFNHIQF